MTEKQKVEVKLSECRKAINTLASKDGSLTEEETAELEKRKSEYGELETRFQALTMTEEEPEKRDTTEKPEDVEKRKLIEQSNLGNIVQSVVERRSTTGPEAELQKELGLESDQIPLVLLEKRAVTPVPGAGEVGQSQAEILMPVFADTSAAFLGIGMPTVGVGDSGYPVLTNRPTVGGPRTDSSAVDETTGSYEVVVLSPETIQASFFWRRSDAARFAGLEESLRSALTSALGEKIDYEVFRGANGLLTGTNLPNNNSAALATYLEYVTKLAYGRVDGRYASSPAMIRTVMGSATYVHASNQFRATESDRSALDRLMDVTGGVRVSDHVAAVSSKKQLAVSRIGDHGRAAVAPIWEGVQLVRDEITKAKTQEVQLTAFMMFAFSIVRKADFHKQQFQVAP